MKLISKLISKRCLVAFSASLVLIASSTAFAQAGVSDDDKHFVEAALKGGMAEVELGKLAADKGASDDVKQFGQKMVDDHTRMGVQMKTVASEIGVKPSDSMSAGGIATKAELEVLSGKTFDDAYIKAMVKDHEEDLQGFKKEAESGTSPTVKRAARRGEITVSHHLEMIKKIAAAHNVSVSSNLHSSSVAAGGASGR
jgi:putative membrane protein